MSGRTRVESKGSWWLFDEDRMVYFRFPKHEAPRERIEWGSAAAGALQDAVPHPYVAWRIEPNPQLGGDRLVIDVGEGWDHAVYAPYARLEETP